MERYLEIKRTQSVDDFAEGIAKYLASVEPAYKYSTWRSDVEGRRGIGFAFVDAARGSWAEILRRKQKFPSFLRQWEPVIHISSNPDTEWVRAGIMNDSLAELMDILEATFGKEVLDYGHEVEPLSA